MRSLHKELFIKLLEKKINANDDIKHESFFNVIKEYLNLERDIENANDKTSVLLRSSRKDYINDLENIIKSSPFYLYTNYYKADLVTIKKLLSEKEIDFYALKPILAAFLKKRKIGYFNNIQFLLNNNNRIDFKHIIILVDNVLREIKFHNISLEIIKSIFKHIEDKDEISLKIQEIFAKSKEKEFPVCFLKIEMPSTLSKKNVIYIQGQALYKVFDENWEPVKNNYLGDRIEEVIGFFIKENNKKSYGKKKGSLYVFETEDLEGVDYRTKVRSMVDCIENDLIWIEHKYDNRKRRLVHNTTYICSKEDFTNYNPFNITIATPKVININNKRHELDVEDFYEEYVIALHSSKEEIDSFKKIYNLLNLIENTKDMTLENQLVILWSSLERICVDLNKKSIISKVMTVSSKSHLMYVLKQELNNIWHLIVENNLHKTLPSIKEALVDPLDEEGIRYNPEKLLETLNEINREDKEVIMKKDIALSAYIHCIVENTMSPENIKKYLKEEELIVNQHIKRIYRHRNILTHSNSHEAFDIEYFVELLRKYLYSLISILIHYTLRNRELNIKDIIYSIDKTCEYYLESIVNGDDFREILKPHYLYL